MTVPLELPVDQFPVEQVLVVPTLLFHELGYFQGFTKQLRPYLGTLLEGGFGRYLPRSEMELDPSYKQLIPYCIFRCGDLIFHYRRSKSGGEGRLRSKRSIGIGGHISTLDQQHASPYREGMRREIEEEVLIETAYRETLWGLLNDDLTDVGKVHLGIVHLFELDAPKVSPREESIIEAGFAPASELIRERDQFETWSQICLDELMTPS